MNVIANNLFPLNPLEVAKKRVSEMRASIPGFNANTPIFLNNDFQEWSQSHGMGLPFDVDGYENGIMDLLKVVNTTSYPKELTRKDCTTCVVVGSAGILAGSKKGPEIDSHDVVIRVNGGPTRCFEGDVGSRTTMRISYPESAPQSPGEYDPESLFVMLPFKDKDLEWLDRVATRKPVVSYNKYYYM
uniref:CMP-N-acetylneuraminate-beta-1,4-galactoside alpha-2,3-sialyltransferase-like n=1 Tax=Saccoglossus kowalevskii TaxID=10224 RepID=A0ABM0MEX0_SACKO|nr:PREDICTED: CMP-N-acetylneuraminate-beta-1,4-galactoside alpha-2,3-sialyltransferase-like [Saccoglossus kowalevskii]